MITKRLRETLEMEVENLREAEKEVDNAMSMLVHNPTWPEHCEYEQALVGMAQKKVSEISRTIADYLNCMADLGAITDEEKDELMKNLKVYLWDVLPDHRKTYEARLRYAARLGEHK